ncbi:MAG: hypothetical protein HY654_01945 [Acidobacteria bacterium]|nr:hypothetical protein [Acidobacteriota bacterium]
MDLLELQTLTDEMQDDQLVASRAYEVALRRFAESSPAGYDSAAFHLARFYNVVEQMALRVAKIFENAIDDEKGWHTELIRRLSIRISGVRPPLFPENLRQPLQELRGFRHMVVHAYDLEVDPEKLALTLKYAQKVAEALPDVVREFVSHVAREQGLDLPQLRSE